MTYFPLVRLTSPVEPCEGWFDHAPETNDVVAINVMDRAVLTYKPPEIPVPKVRHACSCMVRLVEPK